jgi:hypothetical protein
MPFEKINLTSNTEASEIVKSWKKTFPSRGGSIDGKTQGAHSIATQMCEALQRNHALLWLAQSSETSAPLALMIVDDLAGREKKISFLLANVKNPDARGAGRFLVQELINWAVSKQFTLRTISENADRFWSRCPGFKADSDEFVFDPARYRPEALLAVSDGESSEAVHGGHKDRGRRR